LRPSAGDGKIASVIGAATRPSGEKGKKLAGSTNNPTVQFGGSGVGVGAAVAVGAGVGSLVAVAVTAVDAGEAVSAILGLESGGGHWIVQAAARSNTHTRRANRGTGPINKRKYYALSTRRQQATADRSMPGANVNHRDCDILLNSKHEPAG
jgi:hypothetical protein